MLFIQKEGAEEYISLEVVESVIVCGFNVNIALIKCLLLEDWLRAAELPPHQVRELDGPNISPVRVGPEPSASNPSPAL
ncbi:hypothetical protein J6590_036970 [Homalodisca vitripennis]|nr:hypothetical protein J6590_036970 [Homalodisca vitripennis]